MNEANICHICQLKDEKEGEKVKNRAILIKSDRLLVLSTAYTNPQRNFMKFYEIHALSRQPYCSAV